MALGPVNPLADPAAVQQQPDAQPLAPIPGAQNAANLGPRVLLVPDNNNPPPLQPPLDGDVHAVDVNLDGNPDDVNAVDADVAIDPHPPEAVDALAAVPPGPRRRNVQVFLLCMGHTAIKELDDEKQTEYNRRHIAAENFLIQEWGLDPVNSRMTFYFTDQYCEITNAQGVIETRSLTNLNDQGKQLIESAFRYHSTLTGRLGELKPGFNGDDKGNTNGLLPFRETNELLDDLSSNAYEFLERELGTLLALVIPQNHANTQAATSAILKRVAVSELFRELYSTKLGEICTNLQTTYDRLTPVQKNTPAGENIRQQIIEIKKIQFELKRIKPHTVYSGLGFRPIYDRANPPAPNLPYLDIFGNPLTAEFLKTRAREVRDRMTTVLNERVPVYQKNKKDINPAQLKSYAQDIGGLVIHSNDRIQPHEARNAVFNYYREDGQIPRQLSNEEAFFIDEVIRFNEEIPAPADLAAVHPARDPMRARFNELFIRNPQIRIGDAMQPLFDQATRFAMPLAPQPGAAAPVPRMLQPGDAPAQGEQLQEINVRQQLDLAFNETFEQARRILAQNITDAASFKTALYQAGQQQQQNQQQPNQAPLILPQVRPLLQPPKSNWEKFKGWFQRKAPVK